MRYAIEQYDKHGYLKAPIWLWLGWAFLARAWVVFVVAGVSRTSGADILAWVYPSTARLYLGLLSGLPGLVLMWLIGLRDPQRPIINTLAGSGRWITLLTLLLQSAQAGSHSYLQHGSFHWANALTLLILLWLVLYLLRSRRVKDCFSDPMGANR